MARLVQLLRHARGQALLASGRAELRSAVAPAGCAGAAALLSRLSRLPFTPGFASAAEPPDDTNPPAALGQSDSEEDAEGALCYVHKRRASACSTCVCCITVRHAVLDEAAERQRWRQFAEQALDSSEGARSPALQATSRLLL